MAEHAAESVLEKKANAQRRAMGGGAVSVSRALRRGLSIAADALWGLGLAATAVDDVTCDAEQALGQMSDDLLFIVLDGPDDTRALVGLDREVVTGLVEVQTLGKVTRFPVDDRPFTPTDAAMMAPLLDAALPRFASMLAGQPEADQFHDFAFGALVEDRQTAGLVLDAPLYRVFTLDVNLAQDTRAGRAVFVFAEPQLPAAASDPADHAGKYEASLRLVPARMQAVLTRIHIPLSKAQALKPGDVLDISDGSLIATSLVVDGGHVAARGKLGQMNGFRAVRIGDPKPPQHLPPVGADGPPPSGQGAANLPIASSGSEMFPNAPVDIDLNDLGPSFADAASDLID